MKDNVRTIRLDTMESDPIEANHRLMDMLMQFLDEEVGDIFVGAIQVTADGVLVQFESLEGVDPDEIVTRHGLDADPVGSTREDRSHGPDDTTPDPSPTGDPSASSDDPQASSGVGDATATPVHPAGTASVDDPDEAPPWEDGGADTEEEDDEGRARPWALVREDGTTIATYATSEAAWGAFENHDDAFDVEDRNED